RKRDDGDAGASSRSVEVFEGALDAPDESREFRRLETGGLMRDCGLETFSRRSRSERLRPSPGHDTRIYSSATC
ncbi:MAG: hypothetical protein ACRD3M_14490, partial [Thermoanaerobaculia bacterium]